MEFNHIFVFQAAFREVPSGKGQESHLGEGNSSQTQGVFSIMKFPIFANVFFTAVTSVQTQSLIQLTLNN